jgi:hypothetical protein
MTQHPPLPPLFPPDWPRLTPSPPSRCRVTARGRPADARQRVSQYDRDSTATAQSQQTEQLFSRPHIGVAVGGPVRSNTPGPVARFSGYEPVFVFSAWSGGRRGEASYSLSIVCRARDFHVVSVGSLFFFFLRQCRMTCAKQNESVFGGRDEVSVVWKFIGIFLIREQLSRLVLIEQGSTMMVTCLIAWIF